MEIYTADERDLDILLAYDTHIKEDELKISIILKRILIAKSGDEFIGWLRYSLFWDSIPFLNMLYILENQKRKGYGRKLLGAWEKQMKEAGYDALMTSTASNEFAQHFYEKSGYKAIGSFMPKDEPLELLFWKEI